MGTLETAIFLSQEYSTTLALYSNDHSHERLSDLVHLHDRLGFTTIQEALDYLAANPNGIHLIAVEMDMARMNNFQFIHNVVAQNLGIPIYVSYHCVYGTLQDFLIAATLQGLLNRFDAVIWDENAPFTDFGILEVIYPGYIQQIAALNVPVAPAGEGAAEAEPEVPGHGAPPIDALAAQAIQISINAQILPHAPILPEANLVEVNLNIAHPDDAPANAEQVIQNVDLNLNLAPPAEEPNAAQAIQIPHAQIDDDDIDTTFSLAPPAQRRRLE